MANKFLYTLLIVLCGLNAQAQEIPLPEHPNPIFQRDYWMNLNGIWQFQFDEHNQGIQEKWFEQTGFADEITVPFPWGSDLSGQDDLADIGWYQRQIQVPEDWDQPIFLIIGASDWETKVWLDNQYIGKHQGGYIPFEFELTNFLSKGKSHRLTIRVDDTRRSFTLYGKQGYGNARGIWQTVYMEQRSENYIQSVKCTPDIDSELVTVDVILEKQVQDSTSTSIEILTPNGTINSKALFIKNRNKATVRIPIRDPKLWTLEDPYLYEVKVTLNKDLVNTYFGMRKVSVVNLPGTEIPYIALNNKPIYLQMALDQSYHPEGFYTFPSDQFMREEIERSKSIGLNGIRVHIKVEVPRKLYWADKLGLLVMEDLPNSWGEPDEPMRRESVYTLEEMIKRDYNHPSIFSWVLFNETWGLNSYQLTQEGTYQRAYTPETMKWVESMYQYAKSLDQSRLIEDNSICCGRGHTITDINSWHAYLPGYEWDEHLQMISDSTFVGSSFHYENGYKQGPEPNFNSECGNVWGYQGSTGDVDWSYDYHRMMNTFRMFPKIGGWLYTEHHDVINEWNGYWRFDRSEKFTGMEQIVAGMSLKDLHAPIYLSTGNEITYDAEPGETIEVPLFLSSMTDVITSQTLKLEYTLSLIDQAGQEVNMETQNKSIDYTPWMQQSISPLQVRLPNKSGLVKCALILKQNDGTILHRNFVHFVISGSRTVTGTTILSKRPDSYISQKWNGKQWEVMEGLKVNGSGSGHFTYEIKWPGELSNISPEEAYFQVEVSAKELFQKDKEDYDPNQDFMRGSLVANSSNPNSYPMTDETMHPSSCTVTINGRTLGTYPLPDDPADHRGILSWHAQPQDRKLREAGSYGFLLKVPIPEELIEDIRGKGVATIQLSTDSGNGLAIYGKEFGRYPVDVGIVIREQK